MWEGGEMRLEGWVAPLEYETGSRVESGHERYLLMVKEEDPSYPLLSRLAQKVVDDVHDP